MTSSQPPAWYWGEHGKTSSSSLPPSTSSAAFLGHSGNVRQKPFRPPVNPPPYGWADGSDVTFRSTTTDAFLGVNVARQPAFREPKNPPFFSGQDGPSIATSTSKDAFPGFVIPRRPPCKPRADNGPPFSSSMARGTIIRSTSKDAFIDSGARRIRPTRRQPAHMRPAKNPPPYGSSVW